ncbi:MAG: hypothetical protein VXZ24_14055 [Pseudomonadota bacterium]|nr:hypothetical protein [Pseudomonadota bacterium]
MFRFLISNLFLYFLLVFLYDYHSLIFDVDKINRTVDILISSSTGVFAVVGIWFAVIYSEYINLVNVDSSPKTEDSSENFKGEMLRLLDTSSSSLANLIRSILYSMLVVSLAILADFFINIFSIQSIGCWGLALMSLLVFWVLSSYGLAVKCVFIFVLSTDEVGEDKVTKDQV